MRSRFDPYDEELWNCWCPLCMALAGAALRGTGPSSRASEDLFEALESGRHRHQGPNVSPTKFDPRSVRDNGWQMREGTGIGVTPGGVTGSVHR